MKSYDLAFSLGFSCGTTQALRAAGLQFASFPLDWVGVPSLAVSVRAVEGGFAHWLEADDLKLVDVCHGVGFCTRIYLNVRTGFGFSHEFSDFRRFEKSYPDVKDMYDRRIERFLRQTESVKRILAVYVEHADREALPERELQTALAQLRGRFPQAVVDLLYVYEDASCRAPAVRRDADGLTMVAADYRQVEDGRVTQFVNVGLLASWLKSHVTVSDVRTADERRKFSADARQAANGRWGEDKGVLRRWLNHRIYKLYRHLERVMIRRGLAQKERPVWFWDGMDSAEVGRWR